MKIDQLRHLYQTLEVAENLKKRHTNPEIVADIKRYIEYIRKEIKKTEKGTK